MKRFIIIIILYFSLSTLIAQVDCWSCPYNDCTNISCKTSAGQPFMSFSPSDGTGSCDWLCGDFGVSVSCKCQNSAGFMGGSWQRCDLIRVTICNYGSGNCYPSGNCFDEQSDPFDPKYALGICQGC